MAPRWLACVVVGLATQAVYAQTAPVAASEYEDDYEVDSSPIAPYAPPALPDERPTPRPFAGAVWTSGHWYWDGDEWRYKPGAWIAPMSGYRFINGYWRQDPDGWRWVSSGWAQAGSTEVEIPIDVVNQEVTAAQAPPPVQTEAMPPAPSTNVTWAPGYWYWSGSDWVWIEGSWVEPPRPGLVFVSPRWHFRGGSWVFVGGGWAVRGSTHIVVPVYRHAGIRVSWGHPNHFTYSWRRYPMVHRYYHYGHGGRRHYDSGGYRYDSGRYRYDSDRYRHRERGHRDPPPGNHHPATPAREHRGGGRHHH
ncbi:hypothetical protein [Hyalangium gracile]|uniref:hypothetical protein n=1 Tax=Hyalangium gracile TaxID=394092 RepID=UPI001CC917BD|nr:hypothetical protein [Hyalangium gracile]